jgi:Cu/Ag efflux protein CusF
MMPSQIKFLRSLIRPSLAIVFALGCAATLRAQAGAAPRQSGTVKTTSSDSFVLTTAGGQDVTVAVPATAKVLIVPPGAKDLSAATAGSISDVQTGDRALVTGTAGDTGTSLNAARVILMKSSAIAETHAAEEAAWSRGGGGIVKSVDPAAGKIVISSGLRTVTVTATPTTIVRRYSGNSVRFQDAVKSDLASIQPGDQVRVRGTRSPDGTTIAADEIVTGTFKNYSGLLTAVDPAAGTVTLKDLTTKKVVTVAVTPNSDVRRLPTMAANMIAARMRGAAGASGAGAPGGQRSGGAAPQAAGGDQQGAVTGARRAGMDLSQMLSRLPTETIAGLKPGDAVMIVATSPSGQSSQSSAVTLLAGVEPILTAAPTGEGMTLTPWSVGGGEPSMGEGAGPGR